MLILCLDVPTKDDTWFPCDRQDDSHFGQTCQTSAECNGSSILREVDRLNRAWLDV